MLDLTTRQPLRVTLCSLPEKGRGEIVVEKGRREIEEIVDEMKEYDREEKENE